MKGAVLVRATTDREAVAGAPKLLLDPPSITALGLALAWKRSLPGSVIEVVAAGPPEWEPVLREALALGADTARRVAGDVESVTATAATLVAGISKGTALVFCGPVGPEHGSGAVPAALAESLEWPLVLDAVAVAGSGGTTEVVVRTSASRRRRYILTPPAVVVAAAGAPLLLYPPVARRLAAQRATIAAVAAERIAARPIMEVLGYGPPRPRTRQLLRPDESARPGAKLRQLMGAGRPAPTTRLGSAGDDLAGRLLDVLSREGFLNPPAG